MSAIPSPQLPPAVQVFERGWLSANNVLLVDGDEATLIDSGYLSHAEQTLALLRSALGGRRLQRLLNTHSHPDHIGGHASVQRAFGCAVMVPEGMARAVTEWDEHALLITAAAQAGERFGHDATLAAGTRFVAGELEWQALAAPGHDMDALVFYNRERRLLISGDALWRDGFGILFADVLGHGDGVGETRRTLEALGRLAVDAVIPGHGAPFADFDEALERAFARLAAFEADGARIARNAIRGCITFMLLDARRIGLAALTRHLVDTPLYREANARFLDMDPDALTGWLIAELERAGVARREGDALVVR